MYNLTFSNNTVLHIYDSEVITYSGILTIRFSPDVYSFDNIKTFFDGKDIKDTLNEIIKTASDGTYIATFADYTCVKSIALTNYTIDVNTTKDIAALDEDGRDITITVPQVEQQQIELVTVELSYEDPTKVLVEKLNEKINPTIDVETCSLEEIKKYRQKQNKEAMNDYFRNNPLLYTDGLYYGVEDEDRREMSDELIGWSLEKENNPDATLEWHSKGSANIPWDEEDFKALYVAIMNYTKPYFRKMQTIKEAIFSANTKEEVLNIKIFGEE